MTPVRGALDLVLVLVVLVDFFLLASSRPKTGIRTVAAQGVLLAALPVLLARDGLHAAHVVALAGSPWIAFLAFLGGQLLFAILVGLIESSMARLRLVRVPQLLIGATALSAFALVLLLRSAR